MFDLGGKPKKIYGHDCHLQRTRQSQASKEALRGGRRESRYPQRRATPIVATMASRTPTPRSWWTEEDFERANTAHVEWEATDPEIGAAIRCPQCKSPRIEYPQMTRKIHDALAGEHPLRPEDFPEGILLPGLPLHLGQGRRAAAAAGCVGELSARARRFRRTITRHGLRLLAVESLNLSLRTHEMAFRFAPGGGDLRQRGLLRLSRHPEARAGGAGGAERRSAGRAADRRQPAGI